MSANYYSGGFAELVDIPTPLTYSFLKNWFTGKGSLGKTMKLLGLPFEENQISILELIDGELLVNLKIEEETLYRKTVFKYKLQNDFNQTPQLIVDIKKTINPVCIANTSKIILVQSKWISKPDELVDFAKNLIDTIPEKTEDMSIKNLDNVLRDKIWPVVIAIGLLAEFYNQLLIKESKTSINVVNKFISSKIAKKDWFFRSIADQGRVKLNQMKFSDYMIRYGLRADKDYEITSPRWYEIPHVIKKRVESYEDKNLQATNVEISDKLQSLIDTSIELQLLRSVAKQKTLLFIDLLRSRVLQKTKNISDISSLTRENIIDGNILKNIKQNKIETDKKNVPKSKVAVSGKGISVSQGSVTGISLNLKDNEINIPKGTVCIFPNASPEFSQQYPKCEGLIFLKGGQTSHGAIVAREFGIPAIIDSNAGFIKDGIKIELDSTSGRWQLLNI